MIYLLFLCVFSWHSFHRSDSADYVEKYFDQRIDHFNFYTFGSHTYKQRYLYNDKWWNPGKGPIFFYAGNEGDIVTLYNNSGFMLEMAPEFQALILFVEHRYYGESLPFGKDSFEVPAISYLDISQALADYAFLLKSFKMTYNADNCTVIAFGGSYGGQLAAFMRFKYPNIIRGAIAASAPMYQLAGKIPGSVFFQTITKDFRDVSPQCETSVRSAFSQLQQWARSGPPGLAKISEIFSLCDPLTSALDFDHFLRYIRNAFVFAAMQNYPYPVAVFPTFPVKAMCGLIADAQTPVLGLRAAAAFYYNSTHDLSCNRIYEDFVYCGEFTGCGVGPVSMAWDYQCCTEINLEGDSNSVTDMFPALPFDASMRDDYCFKTWKVLPRREWLDVLFWGEDISSSSNIVFSNGDLDPWGPGGVLHNVSETIVTVFIEGGAHHLDLRGSNPADPPSVVAAREFEKSHIRQWLRQ